MVRRIAVVVAVFAASAFVMLKLMPTPANRADYLVAGAAATVVALLALFLLLKGSVALYTRRPKK